MEWSDTFNDEPSFVLFMALLLSFGTFLCIINGPDFISLIIRSVYLMLLLVVLFPIFHVWLVDWGRASPLMVELVISSLHSLDILLRRRSFVIFSPTQ